MNSFKKYSHLIFLFLISFTVNAQDWNGSSLYNFISNLDAYNDDAEDKCRNKESADNFDAITQYGESGVEYGCSFYDILDNGGNGSPCAIAAGMGRERLVGQAHVDSAQGCGRGGGVEIRPEALYR